MTAVINVFTILNLTILALLVAAKKNNSGSNRLLAAIIFTPATPFIINYAFFTGLIFNAPFLFLINLGYLWAPLVYWYVCSMFNEKFNISLNSTPHFIPTILSLSYWIFVLSQDKVYISTLLENLTHNIFPWQLQVLNGIMFLQALIYLSFSTYKIFNYKRNTENNIQPNIIKWLKQFVIILVIINIIVIIIYIVFPQEDVTYIYIPLFYNIIYFLIVYKSFHFGILSEANIKANDDDTVIKKKYNNSTLTEAQLEEYRIKIIRCIENEDPYLDPELSTVDLAFKLDISQHLLSQIINQAFKKNFFDFINSYRVEKAKEMMKDPATSTLTLEAIGLKCGFGSASAFYRAFKKHSGVTPSKFHKS